MAKISHISCVRRQDGYDVFFVQLESAHELVENEIVYSGPFSIEINSVTGFCLAKPAGELRRTKLSLARASNAKIVRPDFASRVGRSKKQGRGPAKVLVLRAS